ncbi:glycosyltransferase family 4 protein [Zavarzinia compransoris]|nr:glycosyltransferase family 4 protein [Zavarzinia marina]
MGTPRATDEACRRAEDPGAPCGPAIGGSSPAVDPRLKGRRIAVDGHNLALPHGTGVATYARTLTYCLRDLGCRVDILYGQRVHLDPAPILREIAFLDPAGVPLRRGALRRVRDAATAFFGRDAEIIDMRGRAIADDVAGTLPYFDRIAAVPRLFQEATRHFRRFGRFLEVRMPETPEIMHWTYPLPVRVAGALNVYTLHDLVPLRLPTLTLDDKKYYHSLIGECIRRADHICTVSERSKADIQDMFDVADDRITNTYQSVVLPAISANQEESESRHYVEEVYGFPWQGYFLFFGAIEPKKNVSRLIEALLKAWPSRPLVIVGNPVWKALNESSFLEDYEREIAATGAARRLYKFGYLPQSHLAGLVRGARAVLFPSLYEGFGLPVVESMLMGTPVLASTEGSFPEIAGDAALLADPYDVDAIARAITDLDSDDELVNRLSARGPEQAARFGIPPYMERLSRMYAKVLGLTAA